MTRQNKHALTLTARSDANSTGVITTESDNYNWSKNCDMCKNTEYVYDKMHWRVVEN